MCFFYHLLFNPSKSKLMYFNISHENLSVKLCGKEVLLVSHETYLGNFIGNDIFHRAITQSVCAFNQSSNHLIADFSMIDSFSLHKLHSNYCMSLYGCELWNYNSRHINDIYVAWRKVIRKLFKLPYRTHNYLMCGNVECITVKLDRRLTKFVHSMINMVLIMTFYLTLLNQYVRFLNQKLINDLLQQSLLAMMHLNLLRKLNI